MGTTAVTGATAVAIANVDGGISGNRSATPCSDHSISTCKDHAVGVIVWKSNEIVATAAREVMIEMYRHKVVRIEVAECCNTCVCCKHLSLVPWEAF